MNEEQEKYYREKFKDIPLEQKRRDLECNPLINHEEILTASDEDIEEVYFILFSSIDISMREVIGESMFEDGYCNDMKGESL